MLIFKRKCVSAAFHRRRFEVIISQTETIIYIFIKYKIHSPSKIFSFWQKGGVRDKSNESLACYFTPDYFLRLALVPEQSKVMAAVAPETNISAFTAVVIAVTNNHISNFLSVYLQNVFSAPTTATTVEAKSIKNHKLSIC